MSDQILPHKLLTAGQLFALIANNVKSEAAEVRGGPEFDPVPVVKLFTPDANATWLLTEVDSEEHDRAFGLCDLGLGHPEFGWCSLGEIARVRGSLRLPVERDRHFKPTKTISAYADDARQAGRISA